MENYENYENSMLPFAYNLREPTALAIEFMTSCSKDPNHPDILGQVLTTTRKLRKNPLCYATISITGCQTSCATSPKL